MLNTSHNGSVVDVAASADSRYLATAGDDGVVCLYKCDEQNDENWIKFGEISSPGGVNSIAWSPQSNPALLVCAREEAKVRIYSGFSQSEEVRLPTFESPLASVGVSVAWAAPEDGEWFAVGCVDGSVSMFVCHEEEWDCQQIDAHPGCPVESLSFSPFTSNGALLLLPHQAQEGGNTVDRHSNPLRLITCGGSEVKVWQQGGPQGAWGSLLLDTPVSAKWVAVAWAPSAGLPFTYVAAGSSEGHLLVWTQDGPPSPLWKGTTLPKVGKRVTRLSWSQAGTFLLASSEDGTSTLFKEQPSGEWEVSSVLTQEQATQLA
ncbi:WD domain, G-beta repeat, putative [Angomonas deanei]|uniref:WD domain, G-beta repeat, putative n=1 Tax=Angomonas deanei TaxID=59799 RepID=A0A7G2CJ82_9TRYP|nr:WD domain, G-beta repeat, putative [Angomonas deanei]